MMRELPTMMSASYGATTSLANQAQAGCAQWVNALPRHYIETTERADLRHLYMQAVSNQPKESAVAYAKRRLVRVLVVDPSDSVPVDKCLLHAGQEQFTDATDQELFFDIDIRSILDTHNAYRITLDDKSSKAETPKKLEAARIRDLKMVVVTLAEF